MEAMTSIAVIGGGKIGEALISGLVASGHDPASITVTNRTPSRREELIEKYGVNGTDDNNRAVAGADIVALCVKPVGVTAMLEEVSDTVDDNDSTTVVSLAAGVTLAQMEESLPAGTPVVRVMPNTPMLVGKGMSAAAPGRYVSDEQMAAVEEMLRAVGEVAVVAESDMDAVTALAGSSPAYYFLVTEALIDAGVQLGLKRDVATKLATTAAEGAGALLGHGEDDPTTLRTNVSSPGGTTVAALRELEESGLRGAFFRAAEKCAQRSAELGK
ncbi:pyrroline-5-carboxylate reductase [Corynebacterium maris]|nr:pyrroline-5-carboxylate reductase [Corynebacterium maris]